MQITPKTQRILKTLNLRIFVKLLLKTFREYLLCVNVKVAMLMKNRQIGLHRRGRAQIRALCGCAGYEGTPSGRHVLCKPCIECYDRTSYWNSGCSRVSYKSFLAKRDYLTTLRLTNGMANPSVRRLSVVSDMRASYSGGLTFLGHFYTICSLAIRQLIPPKITKIVQWDHLQRGR